MKSLFPFSVAKKNKLIGWVAVEWPCQNGAILTQTRSLQIKGSNSVFGTSDLQYQFHYWRHVPNPLSSPAAISVLTSRPLSRIPAVPLIPPSSSPFPLFLPPVFFSTKGAIRKKNDQESFLWKRKKKKNYTEERACEPDNGTLEKAVVMATPQQPGNKSALLIKKLIYGP